MRRADRSRQGNAGKAVSFWQEVIFGVTLLFLGLFLEDWIDGWRNRKRRS